jgi:hypothetical protein
MELRGPPGLGTPIPPSNPWILNTHKEIFIQNDITLFLDVWWFNNSTGAGLLNFLFFILFFRRQPRGAPQGRLRPAGEGEKKFKFKK